jgi:hypothetical protein
MTRKRPAKSTQYAVSDEAAAYIADALMELALQFEATHFAQIRRCAGKFQRRWSGGREHASRFSAHDA